MIVNLVGFDQLLINWALKFEYSVGNQQLSHREYFFRPFVHILAAKVYIFDLKLHQAIFFIVIISKLNFADVNLDDFSLLIDL